MKDFLVQNLKQALHEIEQIGQNEIVRDYELNKDDIETITLKTATEFCLIIGKPEFLFSDIYALF
jgi:hypothetical protein